MALGETSLIISIFTLIGFICDKLRKSRCVKIHSSCCCGDLDIERQIEDEDNNVPNNPIV